MSGLHSCALYHNESERDGAAVEFVRLGLERRDQCILLADSDSHDAFGAALHRAGVEVERALASKALVLVSPRGLRLRGDALDAYRMFRFWRDSLRGARNAHFRGLCAAGQVASFLQGDSLTEHWHAYEQSLTEMTAETNCSFLCQYDRRRATPALIRNVLSAHSSIVTTRYQSTHRVLAQLTATLTFTEIASLLTTDIGARLATIVGHNDAALRALPNAAEARESVLKSQQAARQAGFLLARIRSLSRKPERREEPFDLNDAILEVIELSMPEMRESSVQVHCQLGDGLPFVCADRGQIQYVVFNLLDNARQSAAREIVLRTFQDESRQLHVVVRDCGTGLPGDVHRVFEPFYSTRPGALGLGLSTSRAIVCAHGGEIWASDNAEARGATFQFTLRPFRAATSL